MPVFFVSLVFFSRLVALFSFTPLLSDILQSLSSSSFDQTLLLSLLGSSYGIMQAFFQYPWARLSDFFPRLLLIRILLLFFAISSLGCYLSSSIQSLIFFRALQGTCALQAILLAFLTDYYDEVKLKKAMLFVGLAVGLSLFLGYGAPVVCQLLELKPFSFFLLSTLLSLFSFFLSFFLTEKNNSQSQISPENASLSNLSFHPFALNFCVHFQHSFLMFAIILTSGSTLSSLYLPLLIAALFLSFPALSPKVSLSPTLKFTFMLCLLHLISFPFYPSQALLLIFNFCFLFILESSMPSLVTIFHPQQPKGFLMGISSFVQYIGMSAGFFFAPFITKYSDSVFLVYMLIVLVFSLFTLLTLRELSLANFQKHQTFSDFKNIVA